MTEIQDQTQSPAVSSTTSSRRRAGNGLASLLLPELQSLASQLGISSTKLRKADLISAINAAQAPNRPRAETAPAARASAPAATTDGAAPNGAVKNGAARNGSARNGSAENGSAENGSAQNGSAENGSAQNGSAQNGSAQNGSAANGAARHRSAANGASAADGTGSSPTAAPVADERTDGPTDRSDGRAQRTNGRAERTNGRPERTNGRTPSNNDGNEAQQTAVSVPVVADGVSERSDGANRTDSRPRRNERRDGEVRTQSDQRERTQGEQREPRNQNDRGGQGQGTRQNGQPDRNQPDRNQQDRNQQDRNQQDRNQNNNTRTFDDDDDERGGRRGRRYRDRRGRNRTAGPSGVSAGDVEPTVGEDDVVVPVAGILDCVEDKNSWFVRTAGYFATSDDVFVANSFIRRFNLRRGDAVTGAIRQVPADKREKFSPLVRLDTVNGQDPESIRNRVEFTKLTPLYPQDRLRLETESHILTTRVIDLVMPIGKGQRALIASPPKAGKTMVLQSIANAIATNNPEVHLMVVLIDERPEEVTDMQRSVKGEVIASTFDRHPRDHTTVAELSIERAKRLVEMGHDVVVLLDSITRLGRAYNLAAPASGRILSGGVDSTALYPPKRFLGAARNIENGGSLTILATALVETGSAGDSVIFEEFKGTGNAELKLDRKIADKRIFPAIDVDQSSTRKEEILLSPDELAVTIKLRRVLHALDPQQAIELLLDRLRKTRNNVEFLMQIAKTTPGND